MAAPVAADYTDFADWRGDGVIRKSGGVHAASAPFGAIRVIRGKSC
jgi:hypothetical protein